MTQKISGTDGQGRPVNVTGSAQAARPRDLGQENRTAGQSQSTKARGDIEITAAARQLATLEQVIAKIPVVDESRVKAIASAIADGRYKVDSDKVAGKLLRSDSELAAARRNNR
jgi:negative regulator of flagellin synthesis FlgM